MFDFLSMSDNYEERKVANFSDEKSGLTVDTCSISDSDQPYETGIEYPLYNDGKWVIVEMYNTKKEAQEGHNKWVKLMTSKILPKTLKDVSTSTVAELRNLFTKEGENEYQKKAIGE